MIEKVSVIKCFLGSCIWIGKGLTSKWFRCQGCWAVDWWLGKFPNFCERCCWISIWRWTWDTDFMRVTCNDILYCIYCPRRGGCIHLKLCCGKWCSCASSRWHCVESAACDRAFCCISCLEEWSIASWTYICLCGSCRIIRNRLIPEYCISRYQNWGTTQWALCDFPIILSDWACPSIKCAFEAYCFRIASNNILSHWKLERWWSRQSQFRWSFWCCTARLENRTRLEWTISGIGMREKWSVATSDVDFGCRGRISNCLVTERICR
jgi:hypothetical protein